MNLEDHIYSMTFDLVMADVLQWTKHAWAAWSWKQQAKANSRSLNSEILARLEAGRDGYTSQSDDLVARKLL